MSGQWAFYSVVVDLLGADGSVQLCMVVTVEWILQVWRRCGCIVDTAGWRSSGVAIRLRKSVIGRRHLAMFTLLQKINPCTIFKLKKGSKSKKVFRGWCRSNDLRVMGPPRFHCATLNAGKLCVGVTRLLVTLSEFTRCYIANAILF